MFENSPKENQDNLNCLIQAFMWKSKYLNKIRENSIKNMTIKELTLKKIIHQSMVIHSFVTALPEIKASQMSSRIARTVY